MFIKGIVEKALSSLNREARDTSPFLSYVDRRAILSSKKLLRLGTDYGGWIIPADSGLSTKSICYSAGAGEDISFDCALVERFHCQVRIIDPTPRAIQHFKALGRAVNSGKKFAVNSSQDDYYTSLRNAFAYRLSCSKWVTHLSICSRWILRVPSMRLLKI
jgi:hypothetical protein